MHGREDGKVVSNILDGSCLFVYRSKICNSWDSLLLLLLDFGSESSFISKLCVDRTRACFVRCDVYGAQNLTCRLMFELRWILWRVRWEYLGTIRCIVRCDDALSEYRILRFRVVALMLFCRTPEDRWWEYVLLHFDIEDRTLLGVGCLFFCQAVLLVFVSSNMRPCCRRSPVTTLAGHQTVVKSTNV